MLLFGGVQSGTVKRDVWELSLGCNPDWREITTTNPPSARSDAAGIYDPARKQFVIYGGRNGTGPNSGETWALSLADSSWTRLDTSAVGANCTTGTSGKPCRRSKHTAVYNDSLDLMWIFGGDACVSMQDTWKRQLSGGGNPWAHLCGGDDCDEYYAYERPLIRTNHVEVFDTRNKRAVIFGGDYDGEGGSSDAWVSAPTGCSWDSVTSVPPQPDRVAHTAVYDSLRARMLVFGGGGSPTDSTIALSLPVGGGTPTWSTLHPQGTPPPSTTSDHVAIFDPVEDRMIILDNSGDTYELQFDSVAPGTTSDLYNAERDFDTGILELKWTAPGEDGAGGCQATSYSIRMRSDGEDITEGNWSTSTVVSDAPAPGIPGAVDSITCGGSTHVAGYKFALKTTDYAGNSSSISNSVCIDILNPNFCGSEMVSNPSSARPAGREHAAVPEVAITAVHPNPMLQGTADVAFTLANASAATLEVIDLAGRRLEAHDVTRFGPGKHSLRIGSPSRLSPGHYWVRIRQGDRSSIRGAVVIQ
jgi:hypothetical protein